MKFEVICVAANSNKILKTRFSKEKSVENVIPLPKLDIGSRV
jgi:hypothetical protein